VLSVAKKASIHFRIRTPVLCNRSRTEDVDTRKEPV
jgi:hypothetical protein